MTVEKIISMDLCMNCEACLLTCSKEAIKRREGSSASNYYVDNSKCVQCGNCLKVCPSASIASNNREDETVATEEEHLLKSCACYASDPSVRERGSSGGYVRALMKNILKTQFVDGVFTVQGKYEIGKKKESSLIEDWEGVEDLSTSIYFPISICSGLKELREKTGRFAFVGKPCDVKALRKLQKENWSVYGKIVLVISIFCHHTPTSRSTEMMIKANELKDKRIKQISYRGNGWPGSISFFDENEHLLKSIDYPSGWDKYLAPNIPYACKTCNDPYGVWADISVGDAWPFLKESTAGLSSVIIRTPVGSSAHESAVVGGDIVEHVKDLPFGRFKQNNLESKKMSANTEIWRIRIRLTGYKAYFRMFRSRNISLRSKILLSLK